MRRAGPRGPGRGRTTRTCGPRALAISAASSASPGHFLPVIAAEAEPLGGLQVSPRHSVCYPLYSGQPGWAEESRQMQARIIKSTDVRLHYSMHEFDPWSVAGAVRCPVLVLAGEDDPVCPLSVVEELASRLPAQTTRRVRLPGARHTIFRDRPDLAFPAVRSLASQIRASQPAD